jgi:ABC-type nitrate/sulfonate/bicarbonate transport system ATPase subunit
MQGLLLGLWEAERKTVLFFTHDIDEAEFMELKAELTEQVWVEARAAQAAMA